MGITYVEGFVRGPTGKEQAVRFLVDSFEHQPQDLQCHRAQERFGVAGLA